MQMQALSYYSLNQSKICIKEMTNARANVTVIQHLQSSADK